MKSKCMIFNSAATTIEKFLGMDVMKQIRYLGVTVDNKRNYFQQHKKQKILQARRMTNLTYSVIARSCNKVLLGKTYWKSVVLPSILYASSVVTWTRKELEDLQRTDNQVWRQILGAPRYSQVVALPGEVGASTSTSRDMKSKLNLANHMMMHSKNQLLSNVFEAMWEERRGEWVRQLERYLEEVRVKIYELINMSKEKIKLKVHAWDQARWRQELNI